MKVKRGGAILELAIAIPFLLLLLVGTVDFGRIFYRSMALSQATRAGADWGAESLGNSASTSGIKSAAETAVSSDVTLTDADINTSRSCECATDDGTFSATNPVNTCDGTGCISGQHTVVTLTVTATKAFSTMINYPKIPSPVTITRTTKIRVQ